jgi:hypothetical protein
MIKKILYIILTIGLFTLPVIAQSLGTAGTIQGTVKDPSGAFVARAEVTLENEITNYLRTVSTDNEGHFVFTNIPPNQYHLLVKADGFQSTHEHVNIRSKIPVELDITMKLASQKTEVTVHAEGALVESDPTAHNDISRATIVKLPQSSMAAGLSDIITKGTAGVVADANGFFHPLGDHAQMSFSVDNQPITDQQGYIFSTQLPPNVIESLETIFGGVPAEYGDKTSLVINAVTRSGLGSGTHGSFAVEYGSFGTVGENFTFSQGNKKWGNFVTINTIRSGRFLDTPEYLPMHDIGNNINLFDRLDYQPTAKDTLHLNLFFARSWFQNPNTYDQQSSSQDQRQQVISFNIAPGWVRAINSHTVFTLNPYFRQDRVHFYPSANPFADQPASMTQTRHLTNWGVKSDLALNKGRHNIKTGVQISFTPLQEQFQLGLTDPTYNPVCITTDGTPVLDPSFQNPGQCAAAGYVANPSFAPGLLPYDLTRNGAYFNFNADKTIKQQALFFQDAITLKRLTINAGLRLDHYDGLSKSTSAQPRVGLSYQLGRVGTVLRGSYTRSLETPFNENLLLSSSTGQGGLAQNVFNAYGSFPLQSGNRNQFNVGLQQGFGRFFVLDGDYFWKFTRNAFDLDTLFGTSIIFPIEWAKSKMDGFSLRLNMAEWHGVAAYTLFGHTRARIYGPENGGLIFNAPLPDTVGRIDHDQAFQNTTHIQYQLPKGLPWIAATYRYDSGIVAGAVPDLESLLTLTANQQTTIGFYADGRYATLDNPIREYQGGPWGTRLINIPPTGTQNDDTNPARIKPHHLLDIGAGTDNLFHTDRLRWTLRFTAVNVTNREALYNFLSTCSGTHFLAPRSYRVELGLAF